MLKPQRGLRGDGLMKHETIQGLLYKSITCLFCKHGATQPAFLSLLEKRRMILLGPFSMVILHMQNNIQGFVCRCMQNLSPCNWNCRVLERTLKQFKTIIPLKGSKRIQSSSGDRQWWMGSNHQCCNLIQAQLHVGPSFFCLPWMSHYMDYAV